MVNVDRIQVLIACRVSVMLSQKDACNRRIYVFGELSPVVWNQSDSWVTVHCCQEIMKIMVHLTNHCCPLVR